MNVSDQLRTVDKSDVARAAMDNAKDYLARFDGKLPAKITEQLAKFEARLG